VPTFLIPISFLSVGWFLNDPVGLLRAGTLAISASVLLYFVQRFRFELNLLNLSLIGLLVVYSISSFANRPNWAQIFVGGYQRNAGLLTWISLFLLFIYFSNYQEKKNYFEYSLWIVITLSLIYGYLQMFGVDPLPWKNPYKAVELTIGNPNFAGALVGMLSAVATYRFDKSKGIYWKTGFGLVFLALLGLAIGSKSIQSTVLILIVILVYFFVNFFKETNRIGKIVRGSVYSITGVFILFILFVFTVESNIRDKFFYQGSISQRLDYWRTGLKIFIEHPIFGVGPDQFSRFAALYRTPEQVIRDGAFVIPDKAHSVFIDHLANGGLLAGLFWFLFIGLIFRIGFKLMKQEQSLENRKKLAYLLAIWSAYVFQSFISPDQVMLTTIGFSVAGILVASWNQSIETEKSGKFGRNIEVKPVVLKSISILVALVSIVFYSKAMAADAQAKNLVNVEILDKEKILSTINSFPEPKTTEMIAINTAAIEGKCDLTYSIVNRLLAIDDRSSQAWYIKAVCASQAGNPAEGLQYVQKALKFDPVNPVFLIGQAKLAIGSENLEIARSTAKKLNSMYPMEPSLKQINDYLAEKK